MTETTKQKFVLRVTQDWEYEVTAESPEDAEAIFNEIGGRVGKGECTGYDIEAVVSADKRADYSAEDERAKCTCGHLLYSEHSHYTGCSRSGCTCSGATPLPLGEEQEPADVWEVSDETVPIGGVAAGTIVSCPAWSGGHPVEIVEIEDGTRAHGVTYAAWRDVRKPEGRSTIVRVQSDTQVAPCTLNGTPTP